MGHLELDQVEILTLRILFYSNGLAIWHGFPDITHNYKGNNVHKSVILNLIKLKYFRSYPSLKANILFYGDGLVIWHGLPDIRHIKVNKVSPP